jgi:hypothetical protein
VLGNATLREFFTGGKFHLKLNMFEWEIDSSQVPQGKDETGLWKES